MESHMFSEPILIPDAPINPTWRVDILRRGQVVWTLQVNESILPPRKRKGKVVWKLPSSGDTVPRFGEQEKSRLWEVYKLQKKERRKKPKGEGGNEEDEEDDDEEEDVSESLGPETKDPSSAEKQQERPVVEASEKLSYLQLTRSGPPPPPPGFHLSSPTKRPLEDSIKSPDHVFSESNGHAPVNLSTPVKQTVEENLKLPDDALGLSNGHANAIPVAPSLSEPIIQQRPPPQRSPPPPPPPGLMVVTPQYFVATPAALAEHVATVFIQCMVGRSLMEWLGYYFYNLNPAPSQCSTLLMGQAQAVCLTLQDRIQQWQSLMASARWECNGWTAQLTVGGILVVLTGVTIQPTGSFFYTLSLVLQHEDTVHGYQIINDVLSLFALPHAPVFAESP